MLIDNVKAINLEATKSKNDRSKNLMRIIIGQTQQGGDTSDNAVISICQKLMKSNNEVISKLEEAQVLSDDWKEKLQEAKDENKLLADLLPKYWTEDDVFKLITDQKIDVVSAVNDGAAMGMVTKAMKEASQSPFDGKMVRELILKIRRDASTSQ